MATTPTKEFHSIRDLELAQPNGKPITRYERRLTYRFEPHFHPFVAELVDRLVQRSVRGLQDADTAYKSDDAGPIIPAGKPKPEDFELYAEFFEAAYNPNPGMVEEPHPVKELDFNPGGAYSVYNWELFYHVPLTIAIHLSKNQRYADSQRWLHYIFDPTDDSEGPTPERFWKVKPFQTTVVRRLEEILVLLATDPEDAALSDEDRRLREATLQSLQALKDAPFRPHVVARYRQTAYMFKAVMAYLDNLIAWADALFRQDTGETINEAQQLYVIAANILGPRPQSVPKKGSIEPQTYAALKDRLDAMGNALVELETVLPFDLMGLPGTAAEGDQAAVTRSIGTTLYFCVPRNDKLLAYWDTVADRLFKIRNSLNIQGVFRQLALFEPPIDPAMLARAAAAGLDVASVLSGLNQPLPLVRFQLLLQRAQRIAQEVKSLGGQLLAAIEKEDNEALAVLRAQHESAILSLAESVRYAQWQETTKAREGLQQSLTNAIERHVHYQRLLGAEGTDIREQVPELDELDIDGLDSMQFRQGEPASDLKDILVDIAAEAGVDTGGMQLNFQEVLELTKLDEAAGSRWAAFIAEQLGSAIGLIPEIGGKIQPMGAGADITVGGTMFARMFSMMAAGLRSVADQQGHHAGLASRIGGYDRREQEWAYQSNLAVGEINLTLKQLRASQIREYVAQHEYENHQQQMKQAEETAAFLEGEETQIGTGKHRKTSTQSLYTWMRREAKGLHADCFQLAFDVAQKAERALRRELGDESLQFLEYGYLAGKEGLLAGERLTLDLMRMESAYDDLNSRELELTRHASLLQLDPRALIQLRATGRCNLVIPEEFFDLGGAGEYFRRVKSVAVSIPCVTGPHTSINCTLRLLKSSTRTTPQLRDGVYEREGAEDDRFSDHFGQVESIVTSHGRNDSGLFETNLRDDRTLPFEGSGVISEWQLELPADPSQDEPLQFDYGTISDVILHLRYTARDGGQPLKRAANERLKIAIDEARAVGSVRLLSVRHEFPSAWAKFRSVDLTGGAVVAELKLDFRPELYPFWSSGHLAEIHAIDVFAPELLQVRYQEDGGGDSDELAGQLGKLRHGSLSQLPPAPTGEFSLFLTKNQIDYLWLAVTWGAETD